MDDSLAQLTDLGPVQILIELRLAEEDYLKELVLVSLEITEKPDLFQRLERHRLGLLDEAHDLPAIRVTGKQLRLQLMEQLQAARPRLR